MTTSVHLVRPKESPWQLTWAAGRTAGWPLTAFAVAQCGGGGGGGGEGKAVLPHPGDSEGPDPRVVLPQGHPYPVSKGPPRISLGGGVHRRSGPAAAPGPSPPALTPMAALAGSGRRLYRSPAAGRPPIGRGASRGPAAVPAQEPREAPAPRPRPGAKVGGR